MSRLLSRVANGGWVRVTPQRFLGFLYCPALFRGEDVGVDRLDGVRTWLPEISPASNWRTARSRLAGSQGSVRCLRRVRWVWICWRSAFRATGVESFLQLKVADGSLDAAKANKMVSLPKLLGNDLRRSIRIQETMTNDLTDHS
jgi:hypothetical protein